MKDRLPELDVDVLMFFLSTGQMAVGSMFYTDDMEHWTCNTGMRWYTYIDCAPDFWMPLPPLPKE